VGSNLAVDFLLIHKGCATLGKMGGVVMDPRGTLGSVRLKALEGDLKGRVFEFSPTECVLFGRVSEATVCVPDDPFVSRYHLLMEIDLPSIHISDLGSRNGFLVNNRPFGGQNGSLDERLSSPSPNSTGVGDGDVITVGTNQFQITVVTPALREIPPLPMRDVEPCPSSESPAPVTEGLAVGSVIDRFRIVEELGQSRQGWCYKAVDTRFGHPVILNLLIPEGDFSEERAATFLREVGRLKQLDHPCLAGMQECGRRGSAFFIVRPWIEGIDLARLLKRRGGKLAMAEAVPIMRDVLDGLAYAYDNGAVLHRHLKPKHILTWGEGAGIRAAVADCGVFWALEKAGLHRTIRSRWNFDAPCYWPRERITFNTYVLAVSEVFAIAAVFYQMLTGYLVRDGLFELHNRATWADQPPGLADYLRLMAAGRPVPIREREANVPPGLADLLDRALSEPAIRRGADDPSVILARERFPDPVRLRVAFWDLSPHSLNSGSGPGAGE
jgi:hypothetical protein